MRTHQDAAGPTPFANDYNALIHAHESPAYVLEGTSVDDGGTNDLSLQVNSGTVVSQGTKHSISQQSITLASANSFKRYDLIVVDNNGAVTDRTGSTKTKAPDMKQGDVLLAIVEVPANASGVTNSNIFDARILTEGDTRATGTTTIEGDADGDGSGTVDIAVAGTVHARIQNDGDWERRNVNGAAGDTIRDACTFQDGAGNEFEGVRVEATVDTVTDGSEDTSYTVEAFSGGSRVTMLDLDGANDSAKLRAPSSDPGESAMSASQITVWLDEANDQIEARALESDGTTHLTETLGKPTEDSVGTTEIDMAALDGSGLQVTDNDSALDVGSGSGISVASTSVSVDTSFSPTWTSPHQFDANVTLNMAGAAYSFVGSSSRQYLQRDASNSFAEFGVRSTVSDGGDGVVFSVMAVGDTRASTDRENLAIEYSAGSTQYFIRTEANGTGVHRDINIEAGGNSDQIVAATDGNVGIGQSSPGVVGTGKEVEVGGAQFPRLQTNTNDGTSGLAFVQWADTGTLRFSALYDVSDTRWRLREETNGTDMIHAENGENSPRLPNIPSTSGTTVVVDSNNQLHASSSSERYKHDVTTLDADPACVLDLEAHQGRMDPDGPLEPMFVAEQAAQVCDDLVHWEPATRERTTEDGETVVERRPGVTDAYLDEHGRGDGMVPRAVNYERITVYHNELIKDLRDRVETLEARHA